MNHRASALAAISFLLAAGPLHSAEKLGIQSDADLDAFMQGYYVEPHPELVAAAIDYIGRSDVPKKASALPPLVGFFTEVFASHTERLPEWRVVIDRQPPELRAALDRAAGWASDPSKLLEGMPSSPARNDVCWGAYFGSGKRVYLTQLLAELSHMTERDDLTLFLAAASAKWSLASNARRHPLVKAEIEAALKTSSDGPAAVLHDTLTEPPDKIREEMIAVLREQHEKGKW